MEKEILRGMLDRQIRESVGRDDRDNLLREIKEERENN